METINYRLALVSVLLFVTVFVLHAQTDLTKYVDPWIGTELDFQVLI